MKSSKKFPCPFDLIVVNSHYNKTIDFTHYVYETSIGNVSLQKESDYCRNYSFELKEDCDFMGYSWKYTNRILYKNNKRFEYPYNVLEYLNNDYGYEQDFWIFKHWICFDSQNSITIIESNSIETILMLKIKTDGVITMNNHL